MIQCGVPVHCHRLWWGFINNIFIKGSNWKSHWQIATIDGHILDYIVFHGLLKFWILVDFKEQQYPNFRSAMPVHDGQSKRYNQVKTSLLHKQIRSEYFSKSFTYTPTLLTSNHTILGLMTKRVWWWFKYTSFDVIFLTCFSIQRSLTRAICVIWWHVADLLTCK